MHILNTKDGNTSSKHLFPTEFVTYSTARGKRETKIFFGVQIVEVDFSLNKLLNLARHTVKYGPLYSPIIAHVLIEI